MCNGCSWLWGPHWIPSIPSQNHLPLPPLPTDCCYATCPRCTWYPLYTPPPPAYSSAAPAPCQDSVDPFGKFTGRKKKK